MGGGVRLRACRFLEEVPCGLEARGDSGTRITGPSAEPPCHCICSFSAVLFIYIEETGPRGREGGSPEITHSLETNKPEDEGQMHMEAGGEKKAGILSG